MAGTTIRYNNYHKHTHYSNIKTLDCVSKPEDYIKRAAELGHTTYFTTEHGFQGNIYEAQTLCEKYGLKPIYGVEAYYVDDMCDKSSRENYHLILIAMNRNGQKQINKIMSLANTDGFYYKPRIDLNCLMTLNPNDVIVTSACVASRLFKGDDWKEKFFIPVNDHFKDSFYLEIQDHNESIQIDFNFKILQLHNEFGTKLIHANDSHYILPEDAKYRDLFLKAKGFKYEEERGFILDYPDSAEILKRYSDQRIINVSDAEEALKNTLVFDAAEPIHTDKEFKIPSIPLDYIKEELGDTKCDITDNDEVLREIIKRAWKIEKDKVKKERIPEYKKAILYETDIVKNCGMAQYFILDHIIVKRAIEKYNAVLTRSGRGSAVSFYINKLLGLTEVDRIKAPITLYPTRFMSAERILSSRSLPDIDLNWADVNPVIKASKDILGDDCIYYMVAYKPLQESAAFRLWCKANDYNIKEYDEIAKNLELYVYDRKWGKVIEDSKVFRGVIESIAPSPCSFLLYDKPISEEVGLVKVGDVMCCALDGYNCDYYKFLKNDYLTVAVYRIIDEVYKLIGRPIDDIATLVNNCDDKVWDIYAKGLTTTINQADSNLGKQTLKRYKPRNLAEMSAWVAAIRPGFASMLNNFLDRIPYSTGVDQLDSILEDSFHTMLYQESIMKYLVFLGIEEKGTYDIIKKIAKKKFKEEELNELKKKLELGWKTKVGKTDGFEETWQVVMDAAHYSFNASHSLSVAIDSLYGAYLKANYPLEYFTVTLSLYSGDMDKTANLINELGYFGIKLGTIKFGKSGSSYVMDKETNTIYKGIASVKYCNNQIAEELLELSKNHYDSFVDLLKDINEKTSLDTRQLNILTGLDYFDMFGKNKYLLDVIDVYNKFYKCKQINKNKLEDLGLTEYTMKIYAGTETKSLYKDIDNNGLIKELTKNLENKDMGIIDSVKFQKEYLEYVTYTNPAADSTYYIVLDYVQTKDISKPRFTARRISDGEEIPVRITQGKLFKESPFGEYSVLLIPKFDQQYKKKPDATGKWVETDELENVLTQYEVIK